MKSISEKEFKEKYLSWENENLELKEAKKDFSILWKKKQKKSILWYCVALWNEEGGKLILWVANNWKIVWTKALQNLVEVREKIYNELWIRISTEELNVDWKRVIVISIPSHKIWEPLKFYWKPLMRVWQQLREMDDNTLRKILNEWIYDWSAEIIPEATINDLDEEALQKAKENFKIKNPNLKDEVDKWNTEIFLYKAKLTKKWKLTKTAILLLWKPEARSLLHPAIAQITWILKDKDWVEKDYQHFYCPFILAVDEVLKKIRNLKYRYIRDYSLFPDEVDMYDPYVIREALHNCIAHQDYTLWWRIQLIENEDWYLIFTNKWDFLPWSIEKVLTTEIPPDYYRNKFLVDAMVNLNMIDTIWSWIKRMFQKQKERFFPLPSYDISKDTVSVKIYWKIIDINYSKILAKDKNLSLMDAYWLDKIQKKEKVPKEISDKFRKLWYIEGRYPNIFLSKEISDLIWKKDSYIKNKWFDNHYYKDLIIKYLREYKQATRKEINELLWNKLPDVLDNKQKENKVKNLLYELSKQWIIKNERLGSKSIWKLDEN